MAVIVMYSEGLRTAAQGTFLPAQIQSISGLHPSLDRGHHTPCAAGGTMVILGILFITLRAREKTARAP